ncbi:unnamed protein product [Gordionus sp. m RMFG-2023]|uniref:lysosomal Pro-X carboxypeptidase-like n=1 Tax=Gordionus sp. m RMFG-2023 TaxID=3053472 RepID=UPI0030E08181
MNAVYLKFHEEYFQTYVDHFNYTNNQKFNLRYLINDEYWDNKEGPLFLYTGNEGDIELFSDNTRFIWDLTYKFKALLIYAEHRYYGKSLPFGPNNSFIKENMIYLTSEHALNDFALLIHYYKEDVMKNENLKVICFGGSYGGMLAAWIRMKFPNLVTGSIAASAPLLYFYQMSPCDTFVKIVSQNFKNESDYCFNNIKKSWEIINNYFKFNDTKKLAIIKNIFEICNISQLNFYDKEIFKSWIQDAFISMTMANYPYPANFLGSMPAWPVKEACKFLNKSYNGYDLISNNTDILLLKALYQAISIYSNYTGSTKCNLINSDTSNDSFNLFKKIFLGKPNLKIGQLFKLNEFQASPALGYNNWLYQSCEEMVMPFCSSKSNINHNLMDSSSMFEPSIWNFTAYSLNCQSAFGIIPRPYWLSLYYAGSKDKNQNISIIASSNIIFSNGLLDPWSGGGIYENDTHKDIISIVIPEGAHHLDLREPNPLDPVSVINARLIEQQYIQKWLATSKNYNS